MIADSGAAEIAVAAIAGLSTIVGAALALVGVVYTVRRQKKPRIVELDHDTAHRRFIAERERRIQAEAERDVWKQIALDARHGHPGVDPPDLSLPD